MKIQNVEFQYCDLENEFIDKDFDVIINSQCLSYLKNMNAALEKISSKSKSHSKLISIETLKNFEEANNFISVLLNCGFNIENFSFIINKTFSESNAYSLIIATKKNTSYKFDLEKLFNDVLEKLKILNSNI